MNGGLLMMLINSAFEPKCILAGEHPGQILSVLPNSTCLEYNVSEVRLNLGHFIALHNTTSSVMSFSLLAGLLSPAGLSQCSSSPKN